MSQGKPTEEKPKLGTLLIKILRFIVRNLIALTILGFVLEYTYSVISGEIPKDQQIDAIHLTLIALTFVVLVLLINPNYIERLQLLELSGFKLQLLEKVQVKQFQQEESITKIYSTILPILLPKKERKHLFKLSTGETESYEGCGSLRSELRRLRSIGLIRMVKKDKHIGHMRSDTRFNLADYVELTSEGEVWIEMIKKIEKNDTLNDSNDS
ncbi:PH domain-containing protein [Acaryochloris marina]|uniref:hypothetical protein n=1 Tax=Acaryochloris marina TaxID=155978 RepID=UPI0021C48497|nr:hypothetical protein [Acaryochloris marina]BDM83794.1 hypothetical protein AM10699_66550 [Acaryochloris marina MBIC10699]